MPSKSTQKQPIAAIILIGFILGLFITWGLISGDEQGRVNLLHLILIYVFLPIISLAVSSFSIIFGKGINFVKLISLIPFWSSEQKRQLLLQEYRAGSKWIFFYQSQLAAISFSVASLIVLLVLLLSTDVNFIWRSTLLTAENISPVLQWLAKPWSFWSAAQPSLALLQNTQDSRMTTTVVEAASFSNWWKFVFAAQLFYAFLLRAIAIVVAHFFIKLTNIKTPKGIIHSSTPHTEKLPQTQLAEVSTEIDSDYSLNNWCGLEPCLISQLEKQTNYTRISDLQAGPLATDAQQMVAERWQQPQLILVKGWEPPLAELSDFMQNGNGFLLPLDWDENSLIRLSQEHLDEWRRFAGQLTNWQLLQLEIK